MAEIISYNISYFIVPWIYYARESLIYDDAVPRH